MNPQFRILVAQHYGMCFGVHDALAATEKVASRRPATILGELVHNEVVRQRLNALGAREGKLEAAGATTADVIVTAHGAGSQALEGCGLPGDRHDLSFGPQGACGPFTSGSGGIYADSDREAGSRGSKWVDGGFPGSSRGFERSGSRSPAFFRTLRGSGPDHAAD